MMPRFYHRSGACHGCRLIRREKAAPLIDELAAVLDAMLPKLPGKSELAAAQSSRQDHRSSGTTLTDRRFRKSFFRLCEPDYKQKVDSKQKFHAEYNEMP
jgi:hypothetical protein